MSDTVIQVHDLWKKYRLGELGTGTLRHDFNRWWHRVRGNPDPYAKVGEENKAGGKNQPLGNGSQPSAGRTSDRNPPTAVLQPQSSDLADDEVWALRGVSFEVKQGEILGVIGRNGAGKSTLLKILSRVTAPTNGEIRVKGRMASLLEVGTGFHPELTGRDNIFLNGSILGMNKAEIRTKLEEIVEFSGVERYIDTPVKRYSSGMYVRLAFAVAAHLEPEILIVDEVLAVGDAEFQKKCLGKMQDVASKEGRTILFVSHNIVAIQTLCTRGILLSHGSLQIAGKTRDCIETYLDQNTGTDHFTHSQEIGRPICILGGRLKRLEDPDANMQVEVEIASDRSCNVSLDMRLFERAGSSVGFGSLGVFRRDQLISLQKGRNSIKFTFPLGPLANGSYVISLDLTLPGKEYLQRIERCLSFEVYQAVPAGSDNTMLQSWGYGSLRIPMSLQNNDCQPVM